ncbi:MAG: MarR family winged helix-turn-helix transcriptional regulator [Eubacteriales bacterium]
MDIIQSFQQSLQKIYDMGAVSSLMEFCQGEIRVLMYLNDNNKVVFPSDLSDALSVTRQRIASVLSSLRKKGYVSMEIAEHDRRRMKVMLTAKGESFIVEKRNSAEAYVSHFIAAFGEENAKDMTRLIELSAEAMKALANTDEIR